LGDDIAMRILDASPALVRLFRELTDGVKDRGTGFMLNTGDIGLLASIDKISAADASRFVNDGATIAAHAQHLRYGLALMNQWAAEGGNPFANAKWDEAWKITTVSDDAWQEIRTGLREEATRWSGALKSDKEMSDADFTAMVSSIGHLAYHFGAIRQINKAARGPKEGTF
jgi:hypothetical protein